MYVNITVYIVIGNYKMKVSVESCLKKVDNRFKLVLLASKRAKDIDRGARPAVARDDDKSTVIAMREISEEAISLDSLESITKSNIVNRNNEMLIEEEEELFDAEDMADSEDDISEEIDDSDDTCEEDSNSDMDDNIDEDEYDNEIEECHDVESSEQIKNNLD